MVVTGETESTKEREQVKNQGTVMHTLKTMIGSLNLMRWGRRSILGIQRDEI